MAAEHSNETREAVAAREVGHTDIRPGTARVVVCAFLGLIGLVAPIQGVLDAPKPPFALSIFPGIARAAQAFRAGAPLERPPAPEAPFLRRLRAANDQMLIEIHAYEDTQKDEEHSFLTARLVTPVQAVTTRWFGHGNEQGYPGRDGWAFFRDAVESLTGPGFLEERQLARRAAGGTEWRPAPQPDPRRAIHALDAYLQGRGIRLLVVPAPVKATVHPDKLSSRYAPDAAPVQNPSFDAWVRDLEGTGVAVFDPAPHLVRRKAAGPQYLETDTHWRPDAMEATAAALAAYIRDLQILPDGGGAEFRRGARDVTAFGDVVANLLKLAGTGVYPPETMTIHPVTDADGEPWASDPEADVLLLGDSFANIYSATNLPWGEGAGLAEQLSYALGRPVDRISRNDGGSHAACRALEAALRQGDRLATKRLVIWQFAARELAVGDWQVIAWDDIPVGAAAVAAVTVPGGEPVQGVIRQVTRPPRPGSVPYRDCIIEMHLADIDGNIPDEEAVVYLLGMRDNQWTPAAELAPGQTVNLHLTDWSTASQDPALETMRHEPLNDPDMSLILLPEYWGELDADG
jgi:alginate O-acetyltransferase complex protein AlgJ